MRICWADETWEDYLWWQAQDRRTLTSVNSLIQDIARNGNEGLGKPEALRHHLSGSWSRRITEKHRLVYRIADTKIQIAAGSYHYGR
ncbi:MAG: Txe/YoeB family addiction module toxin [Propionibacterium sp.]|jgi:addiction module toxin, txe/yoeB family|nr:Txe/YoeB family addiction module toxin [Propionibacterium sp.]